MGILSAIGAAIGLRAGADGEGGRDASDSRFWGGSGMAPLVAGMSVTWQSGLQLDVVQAVMARLSGTCSTLPLMVFKRSEDGDASTPARDHPLYRLLHRAPNARQTAQEFRAEQVGHLVYWRNAYSRIHADPQTGAPVGSLEQIHPSRLLNLWRGPDGYAYYQFSELAPAIGSFVLREDSVWHVRMAPLTEDGLRGKYTWETSRDTLARALAVEAFGLRYFANGGAGGGTLQHPGAFKDKEEQGRFLEAWREGGTGLNQHKDRLLLNGVTYTRFTVNNDEAQFLETKKEMGAAVARLWNMPPHMVGLLDKATFSNIEQQSLEYVVYTVAPFLAAIEQAAWRDLLVGDDQDEYFVEHNVNGLLRGDWKSRWQGYAWGRQWGWLSVNDVRRMENMPSIGPAGDERLVPMNMNAAGSPGTDGTATAAPGSGDPDESEREDPNAP